MAIKILAEFVSLLAVGQQPKRYQEHQEQHQQVFDCPDHASSSYSTDEGKSRRTQGRFNYREDSRPSLTALLRHRITIWRARRLIDRAHRCVDKAVRLCPRMLRSTGCEQPTRTESIVR